MEFVRRLTLLPSLSDGFPVRLLVVLLGLALHPAAVVLAQPFKTLDILAAGTVNVNRNDLHTLWSPGQGAALAVEMPFYLGTVSVGAAVHTYGADTPMVPAFSAVYGFVGWGLEIQPLPRLRLQASARLGPYRMAFDDFAIEDDTALEFRGGQTESELGLSAVTRLHLNATQRWGLFVEGSYTQVYTFVRIKLLYATVGLRYRLDTPSWLRKVLD